MVRNASLVALVPSLLMGLVACSSHASDGATTSQEAGPQMGAGDARSPFDAAAGSPPEGPLDATVDSPPEASLDAGVDAPPAAPALVVDVEDEEQLGPFASWINVHTAYGATGDGTTDDTAAIQKALSNLCVVGVAPGQGGCNFVLYFPSGTYRITKTLTMEMNYGASLVGEDPTTTSLVWGGAAGGTMLLTSGSNDTVFTRLTWNGNSSAGIGVAQWWNHTVDQNYQGGLKHIDEVFEDLGIGIFGGKAGADYGEGDSETTIRRVHFLRATQAGVNLGSFNALDWWIWDSVFTDCARGVTNDYSYLGVPGDGDGDAGATAGAGNFMIYRSLFQGSTEADVEIHNTDVWFSLHDNVSIHSNQFIRALPIGDNGADIVAENNRVIETVEPTPIHVTNTGTLILVDNQIRIAPGADAGAPVVLMDDGVTIGRNVLTLGNQITQGPVAAFTTVSGSGDRLISISDETVPAGSISEALPAVQPIATNFHRTVFEVPVGSSADAIQSTIDAAANSDAGANVVVHLPGGTYDLDHTVTVPAKTRLILAGDGMAATVLNWTGTADSNGTMIALAGPSYASVRDLTFVAAAATGIDLSGADQIGGRIFLDGVNLIAPIVASGLQSTRLSMQATQPDGLTTIGCKSVISMGGTFGQNPIDVEDGTVELLSDHWYEGATSELFRGTSGTFTYIGGMIAPYSHGIEPDAGLDASSPSVLIDGFDGSVSFIAPSFDLVTGSASAANGILVENATSNTTAAIVGTSANRSGFFSRTGDGGAVGVVLSKGWNDADIAVDLPDIGRSDVAFVTQAFQQARGVQWASSPFVSTPGATDVRIAHVAVNTSIQKSTGIALSIEP